MGAGIFQENPINQRKIAAGCVHFGGNGRQQTIGSHYIAIKNVQEMIGAGRWGKGMIVWQRG